MRLLLALLYVCSGLPTKGDSMGQNMGNIVSIAQTTLVHIKELRTQLPAAPHVDAATPPLEGLAGIIQHLGALDDELQSAPTGLLGQIQADVSSLHGRLRSLAQSRGCAVWDGAAGAPGDGRFPESRLYLTLAKVQRYLDEVLHNMNKVKVC
ncbi:leptin-B-like [Betta splendens]|uniref:Leptin-B-like n=1 Tax=Betta splendens TaxID=158456 RepID=A0A9W2Y254_BETSP|nr:leptin-B-like [Betta splendens]